MNRWISMGLVAPCALSACMKNEVEYVFVRSATGEDPVELIVPEIGEAGLGGVELGSLDLSTVEYSLAARHRGYLLEGDVDLGDPSGRSFALEPLEVGQIGHVDVEGIGPWRSVRVFDIGYCSHVAPWGSIATKWVERLTLRIVAAPEFTNGRRDGIAVVSPRLALDRTRDESTGADTLAIDIPIAADRYTVDPSGALGCDEVRLTLVANIAAVSNAMNVVSTEARIEHAIGCTIEQTRAIVRELERSMAHFAGTEMYRLVVEDASRAAGDCGPEACTTVPVGVSRFHVRPEGIEAVVAEYDRRGLPPSADELCDPLRMPEPNPDVPFPIFVP